MAAVKKTLDVLIVVPIVVVFALCTYGFIDAALANSQASKTRYIGMTLDEAYRAAKSLNKDVVGWIYLRDTGVCQPICQTSDNSYYLTHDIERKDRFGGTPFLDCRADKNFMRGVPIVYGHNMEGSSMFGDVNKYVNQEFAQKHRSGALCINGNWYEIEVCNLLYCVDGDTSIYEIYDDSSVGRYVNRVADCLVTDLSKIADSDNLVGLSTCTDNGAFRHVLTVRVGSYNNNIGYERI